MGQDSIFFFLFLRTFSYLLLVGLLPSNCKVIAILQLYVSFSFQKFCFFDVFLNLQSVSAYSNLRSLKHLTLNSVKNGGASSKPTTPVPNLSIIKFPAQELVLSFKVPPCILSVIDGVRYTWANSESPKNRCKSKADKELCSL